jgi:taurine--2-oxoglutarate transaminase
MNRFELEAQEIVDLSRRHTFFSWSAQDAVRPIPMVRGEGCFFWDAAGKRYFDLNSQSMCVNIGHGNRRVIEAIKAQAEELVYAGPGMATPIRAELGRALAARMPGALGKFFFTQSGAEANENAVKLARAATGRFKILARYRSYHGATAGAMTLTGDHRRWANEPGMPGVVHIPDPYRYRSPLFREGDSDQRFAGLLLEQIEDIIRCEGAQTIAALVVETIAGTNGVVVPPDGYLQGLRQLCDRYGILLVCDEVMTGFGRTGKWFAVDHWNVVPDLMTMAKGLTSAYLPLGAVAMSESIAGRFRESVYYGGLTYNAHPMCLAAALANLQVIEDEGLVENSAWLGQVLAERLAAMAEKHELIGEVRSLGLFGCIELVRDRASKAPLGEAGQPAPEMAQLVQDLRRRGVYAHTWRNLLLLVPPLIVAEPALREVLATVDEALGCLHPPT